MKPLQGSARCFWCFSWELFVRTWGMCDENQPTEITVSDLAPQKCNRHVKWPEQNRANSGQWITHLVMVDVPSCASAMLLILTKGVLLTAEPASLVIKLVVANCPIGFNGIWTSLTANMPHLKRAVDHITWHLWLQNEIITRGGGGQRPWVKAPTLCHSCH